jgi:hypothetical protein
MPLLVSNAISKGKASEREPGHGRQTPQSRNQQQMLVGDREQTSTNRPQDCLRWKIVW